MVDNHKYLETKMESEKLIFAIGNPLLDISAVCDKETLDKYGLINGGACLAEEKHKELFEELWKKDNVETIPGGAAMNALRSANFMLKGNEYSCLYFGSISDDERGAVLKKALDTEKINHNFSIAEDTYTGAWAVVINHKERALCADLAACLKYKTSHFEANVDLLADYKIIYTTGFFITSNFEALIKAANYAVEHNKIFAFNLSAVFLIYGHKAQYEEILEYTDFVFCNESEIDAFGQIHDCGTTKREEIVEYIAKLPKKNTERPRSVICTQGSNSTISSTHDHKTNETKNETHEVELLDESEIVDLNSAGDSFVGGYLAATVLGYDAEVAIKAAHYCARYIIQSSGCSFPRPNEFEF